MNVETIGTWAGLVWNALNENDVLGNKDKLNEVIISQLEEVSKKYGKPMGKYALLSIPEVLLMYGEDIEYTIDILY